MEDNKIVIEIPEEITTLVQKYDTERSARRDIIIRILEKDIDIPQERFDKYQKEFDEKYFSFEQAKRQVEKDYVIPATGGRKCTWTLNYQDNTVTIILKDE